ncbi:hypothetical protein EAH87_09890 [Sphingomonas koreensis]|nr:hypothetical protein EAH87_09890 [Sphingomonas koreensis]
MIAIAAASATPAAAQSVFDGTWKMDTASAKPSTKPSVVVLKSGVFSCESCTPAYTVKADGAFHPVSGQLGFDAAAVSIVDPHTAKMQFSKGGRVIDSETDTVSADGKTLNYVNIDSSATSGKTTKEVGIQTRVGPAPVGAHAASGSWQTTKIVSSTGDLAVFHSDGAHLDARFPSGVHYAPTFGGGYVPVEGTVQGVTVAVAKQGPRAFVARYRMGGKVRSTTTFTVAADGKTATVATHDLNDGTDSSVNAYKQ